MKKTCIIITSLFLLLSACSDQMLDISYSEEENNPKSSTAAAYPSPYEESSLVVTASTTAQLIQFIAQGNITILLEDGTYTLNDRIWVSKKNVTIRSKSGNRDGVILKGKGMAGSVGWIFGIAADYFSLKDVTLSDVYYHGIQVHGELDADHLYIKNVVFRNIRQQMIKGSFDKNNPGKHSDSGIIEDCLFEYTAGQGYYWYCGGIDVHHGENWIVRNNTFKNIISPESRLAEGAVHFWSDSKNIIIEGNRIINCGRGIMLGLDSSNHYGGIIRNNTIHVVRDTGIYLCNTRDVKVYNNTVYNHNSAYPNSIEYRFSGCSGLEIKNNLTNKNISSRNGASALTASNQTGALSSWFINAAAGDLHLASAVFEVVNAGETLTEVTYDIDGETRSVPYDIGADEF